LKRAIFVASLFAFSLKLFGDYGRVERTGQENFEWREISFVIMETIFVIRDEKPWLV
jgi:hypothetical protein